MSRWISLGPAIALLSGVACSTSAGTTSDGGAVDAQPADAGVDVQPQPDGGAAADWSCLGAVTYPPATKPAVKLAFANFDVLTGKPVVGAEVKACPRDDAACASAIATVTTDDQGIATFAALPTGTLGFDGYLAVSVPRDSTNLNFVNPPIGVDHPSYNRVYWSYASFSVALGTAGITQDAARGIVAVEVHDCTEMPGGKPCMGQPSCSGRLAAGVSLEIDVTDPAIRRAYIDGKSSKLSTTATMTDESGKMGFANVPPGTVTVTAKVAATGKLVGKQTVFVRAGTPSMLTLPPTP